MYDELIVGNRGWSLAESSGSFVLASTYAPDIWPKGVIHAECRCNDSYYKYIVPSECLFRDFHSCGLVALKPNCNLINGTVYGTVAMFGKIQEYEFGYRSEHAFITALFQDESFCDVCWTDEYVEMDQDQNPYLLTTTVNISRATMIGKRLGEWSSLYCSPHAAERESNEVLYSYPEVMRSLALTYDVPLILRERDHEQ